MGIVNGVGEVLGTVFGNNLTKAFSKEALSGVELSLAAVQRSSCKAGKDFLNLAVKKGAMTQEAVDKIFKERSKNFFAADAISAFTENKEKFMEIAKNDEMFAKAIENFADVKNDSSVAKKLLNFYENTDNGKKNVIDEASKYFGKENGKVGLKNIAAGYFLDQQYGKTRIAGAAAAYGGTALAVRTLSGGNLTTNARGERDIAGIPIF